MAYLDLTAFRARTVMPGAFVDEIEADAAGWIAQQLATWSFAIDARLRKRYTVPFVTPPETVLAWLTNIVTLRAWLRRGFDPQDPSMPVVTADHDRALEEIKEAANGQVGLFDLPLADAGDPSAITKGGPRLYSEQSPYVGFSRQAREAREEDRNGEGTTYGR